ncbi:HAD family hydrolase [Thalassolituus marinus]|uniref:Uncharacterized protein n=1 Tax=Thalassolituus marinus TaxID=671053 RepID=A0ABS7ZYK7_9GAMM|nr:hypothetical protein [Thalassolituus marinus]MCA6065450.1 hypothetical protein [Thalassolituus marinus]
MNIIVELSYQEVTLFAWLREESTDICDYQAYPASPEAQAYLPMSFAEQRSCLTSLERKGVLLTRKGDVGLEYMLDRAWLERFATNLDLYSQQDNVENEANPHFTVVKMA